MASKKSMEGYSMETLEVIVANPDSKADRVAIAKELLAERKANEKLKVKPRKDEPLRMLEGGPLLKKAKTKDIIEQSDDEQSEEDYEKPPKSSGCKTPKVALKESVSSESDEEDEDEEESEEESGEESEESEEEEEVKPGSKKAAVAKKPQAGRKVVKRKNLDDDDKHKYYKWEYLLPKETKWRNGVTLPQGATVSAYTPICFCPRETVHRFRNSSNAVRHHDTCKNLDKSARGKTVKRFLEKDDSRKNLDKAIEKVAKKFRPAKLTADCDKVETPKSNRKAVKTIPKSSASEDEEMKIPIKKEPVVKETPLSTPRATRTSGGSGSSGVGRSRIDSEEKIEDVGRGNQGSRGGHGVPVLSTGKVLKEEMKHSLRRFF